RLKCKIVLIGAAGHEVLPGSAYDEVSTRLAKKIVVARTAAHQVAKVAAEHVIVARLAEHGVRAPKPENAVVAQAAEQFVGNRVSSENVVALLTQDVEPVGVEGDRVGALAAEGPLVGNGAGIDVVAVRPL